MNRVLRGIFGPEKGEVRGEWIKLHSEELNDLYIPENIFLCDQIKKNELFGSCRTHEGEEKSIHVIGGKT